jgi:hypothetical protein
LVEKKGDEKGDKKENGEGEGKEGEEANKGLVETATDFNFMKSGIKRFLITIALFVVTDLTDRSFKTIWGLRTNNPLATVLLSAVMVKFQIFFNFLGLSLPFFGAFDCHLDSYS